MTLLLLSKLEMYVKCIKIHQQAFKAARDGKQLQLKKCLQLPIVSMYKEATLCKAKTTQQLYAKPTISSTVNSLING